VLSSSRFGFCFAQAKKKGNKPFFPFFLQRNETKENRRCANRSLLPAFYLRNGFQGALNDTL